MDILTVLTEDWSDAAIEREVTAGIRGLQRTLGCFKSNQGLRGDNFLADLKVPLRPNEKAMVHVFKAYRNWGYLDQPDPSDTAIVMDDETMWHAQAFVVSACMLTDFFSVDYPATCLSAINTLYARCKIIRHLRGEEGLPRYVQEGLFDSVIDGETVFGLTVHQVALLAGVTEQAVRNAMTRSDWFKMEIEEQGKSIPVEKALRWLKAKPAFEVASEPTRDNDILVPVAGDESYFCMACKQRAGFKVGPKGREVYHETFESALEAMDHTRSNGEPVYFRRPNANQRFAIVRAVRWQYMSRDDVMAPD
jgi:hypothetical protein